MFTRRFYHENNMKKDSIKAAYILTINFKPVLMLEEKPLFPDGNEENVKMFSKLFIICYFFL